MRPLFSLISMLLITSFAIGQEIRLVPQDYPSIQSALDISNVGDQILVSPGVYYEHLIWPESVDGIILRSTDGAESTIIDGSEAGRPLTINGNDLIGSATIIEGFTIKNGYVNVTVGTGRGGGVNVFEASPTLLNLIIESNLIDSKNARGGGINLKNSTSFIENCIVRNNSIVAEGQAYGAGVQMEDSNAEFHNCKIEKNETISEDKAFGGGLYLSASSIQLVGCVISKNNTIGYNNQGAAMRISNNGSNEIVNIVGCTISHNISTGTVKRGVAMYVLGGTFNLVNSLIHDNGNSSTNMSFNFGTVNILHTTITRNKEGIDNVSADLNIRNSIIWDNEVGRSIHLEYQGEIATINADHSLIEGGYSKVEFGEIVVVELIDNGNIQGDPLFVFEDHFIPSEESPCINAGNPEIGFDIDIKGSVRPLPFGSNPDIGAYEINQKFAYLLSRFFLDINADGMQNAGEEFIGAGAVKVNNDIVEVNTRADGLFTVVESGDLNVSYHQFDNDIWELTSSISEFSYLVGDEEFSDTIVFGLSAPREIKNVEAGIYSPIFRCSRTITMEFIATNNGTTIEDGILWATLDPRVSEVNPLIEADYDDGSRLGWDYTNLFPAETFKRLVSFKVPAVTDIEPGGLLQFVSETISIEDPECKDEFIYEDIIRCSYDPNDKLINPNREDHLVLRDQDITYTVRFQNVGNDYADDVLVVDTLDANFDYSTFKFLSTSHPDQLKYTLSSEGILNFDFQKIYLPDSTRDEQGSNGYVMYSIRTDSTLVDYSTIENTAHIYFDFNPAIITNTTTNQVVEEYPIVSVFDNHSAFDVNIYPNPTTGLVHFSERLDQIEIFDLSGKLILLEKNSKEVDIGDNVNGAYIARLKKGGEVVYKKITLMQ